jgi:hypothetical protein
MTTIFILEFFSKLYTWIKPTHEQNSSSQQSGYPPKNEDNLSSGDGLIQQKTIYCNRCSQETNHYLKAIHIFNQRDQNRSDSEVDWERQWTYILWICAGCNHGVLEENFTTPLNNPDLLRIYKYFPESEKEHLRKKKFVNVPHKINSIYKETVLAFNHNQEILCSAGIRTIIEAICDDKGVVGKNLVSKIDGLSNFIPKEIVTNLHSLRFIGNTALHELETPENDTLRLAIKVTEDLLIYLYDFPKNSLELFASL